MLKGQIDKINSLSLMSVLLLVIQNANDKTSMKIRKKLMFPIDILKIFVKFRFCVNVVCFVRTEKNVFEVQ